MSARVALRSDTREREFTPAYKEGALVSAQALSQIQEHILGLTAYIQDKDKEYQGITGEMQREIRSLRDDKGALLGRLGKLESALKGAEETTRATQGALQQVKQENAHLKQLICDSNAQSAKLAAELGIAQREQGLLKNSMKWQTTKLKESVRRTDLQEQLQRKQTEKTKLEKDLTTIRGDLQKQKDKIAIPTAVVAGGALGLITGGLGWILAGFAAGAAGGTVAASSPICPCVTTLHAKLGSTQEQLNLVEQEISDLEAQLNPPK